MLLVLVALSALAIVPGSASGTPSRSGVVLAASRACASQAPQQLRLTRVSATSARLSWRAPKGTRRGTRLTYRVLRARETIGQTRAGSLMARITLGRTATYTVEVLHGERPSACAAKLRAAVAFRPPGQVRDLFVFNSSATSVTVGWLAATRGDAALAGYRVQRDGVVAGQTSGLTYTLHLSGARQHTVAVMAVDRRGELGAASATLVIGARQPVATVTPPLQAASATHTAPSAPALISAVRVSDTSATLSWQAGSANEGATVAGYLLLQDGQPVGVVHGQITTVALASKREYTFTVRTLDSDGYLSEPAPAVTVVTTHTPPPAPTGLTATNVTSQSALVSWSPSTAVSGTIVGYRVFRDEIPVGQTASLAMALSSLAPSSEYQVSVSAVDSLGAISPPTAPLAIRTAEPTPTHGNVQAFLLDSVSQSFEDLEAHYQQVGVVYPTYFECGANGEVLGKDDPLVTKWAEARKIEVLPRLNCQKVSVEEHLLGDVTAREELIESLAALCQTYGYQGVQIDFEAAPPSDRNPFTAFITKLAERLHAQQDKLSTIVTAKYYNVMSGRAAMYDDAALSVPSDYLVVLDWGLHWTTSAPGSMDEMAWFKKVAEYTATLPNRNKFVIGMPMYGIDWAEGGGPSHPGTSLEYSEIMKLAGEVGASPEWEANAQSPRFSYTDGGGAHHEVWFTDQRSIGARAELAQSLGLGVGLWRLGSEDQSVWELPVLGAS
jgi:spore germination protein YaaH